MSYSRTVHLPVPPDEAFALVTEPERLRRWQTVSAAVDLRAGGSYRWTVTPGHIAAGTFREVEPGRRIVYGWGWVGDQALPPDASTVTVTIAPADGGSSVTLEHDGLTEEQAERHAEGWAHFLKRLEDVAATGDAGRDDWARVPAALEPVTAAEAVLAAVQPVLRGVTTEDHPLQTPCTQFTVGELVDHLLGGLSTLAAMAGSTDDSPTVGSVENRVSVLTARVLDALRSSDDDADDAPRESSGIAATVLPVELLLHGWDLAAATGADLDVDDDLVAYVHGLAEQIIPGGRANGSFADEIQAAPDASAADRLAAYAGRSPHVA